MQLGQSVSNNHIIPAIITGQMSRPSTPSKATDNNDNDVVDVQDIIDQVNTAIDSAAEVDDEA